MKKTVAQLKKEENIAEYVLYIWQIQDLTRANKLNTETLFQQLGLTDQNDPEKTERSWLTSLVQQMKTEKLEKTGNLSTINILLSELLLLHNTLLELLKNHKYISLFKSSQSHLEGLMAQAKNPQQNIVEHMLVALYGWLILRMQKKEISSDTEKAMKEISQTMAYLSAKYKEMKTDTSQHELN